MKDYNKVEFDELILIIDDNFNVVDFIIEEKKDNENNKDKENE